MALKSVRMVVLENKVTTLKPEREVQDEKRSDGKIDLIVCMGNPEDDEIVDLVPDGDKG